MAKTIVSKTIILSSNLSAPAKEKKGKKMKTIITALMLFCSIGLAKPVPKGGVEEKAVGHFVFTNKDFVPVEVILHCGSGYELVNIVLSPRTREEIFLRFTWGGFPGCDVIAWNETEISK